MLLQILLAQNDPFVKGHRAVLVEIPFGEKGLGPAGLQRFDQNDLSVVIMVHRIKIMLEARLVLGGQFQRDRRRYQNQFDYLHVDEIQDTNRIQNEIVDLLARENNLFIVGPMTKYPIFSR